MTTIDVHPSALGQLAYHVACSAHLAAGERSDECVPHAVLSWALLEAIGGEQLDAAISGFDLPDDIGDIRAPAAKPIRHPVIASSLSERRPICGMPDGDNSSALIASIAVWQARPLVISR